MPKTLCHINKQSNTISFTVSPLLNTALTTLGHILMRKGWQCATAESCTGGLLGASITAVPGASQWFAGSIVAYANRIKTALLHVNQHILIEHGAVSEACVLAMAKGLCSKLDVQVGVSISGIAGPSGGSTDKPVGTVWLGFYIDGKNFAVHHVFTGGREDIRAQAIQKAVEILLDYVTKDAP